MSRRSEPERYDVVVLGGGSAGYAAARTAAAAGRRVAVIEGGRRVGGLCILRGCMPTKALLHAAEVLHLARRSGTWGLEVPAAGYDFRRVMARKDALVRSFAADRRGALTDGRFALLRGRGRFLDPHRLALDDGRVVRAQQCVIATGSRVGPPPFPALAQAGYITSDEALALKTPPRSLIVLGGGPVALEFAQFFARFDTQVTVIQRGGRVLKASDADAAEALERALRREGLRIFTGTRLLDARRTGRRKEIQFDQGGRRRVAVADEILFALGRVPDTASLGLDAAGVATRDGRILTDVRMRTSVPHIFAAGDCTSGHEIVHLAVIQGEVAGHNAAWPRRLRETDDRVLLSVVFTEPQVAAVGLTEQAAQARGLAYRAASYRFADHGKSMILGARDGFVKLLAEPRRGEIVGGACVGPAAGELIHEIAAAMAGRLTVRDLAALPHYHPTLAEIWTYPAEELARALPLQGRMGGA